MKAVGERVVLRVDRWDGEQPEPGDFLRTSTGRCYRIDDVLNRHLRCTVLDDDAVQFGAEGVWRWEWSARARSVR